MQCNIRRVCKADPRCRFISEASRQRLKSAKDVAKDVRQQDILEVCADSRNSGQKDHVNTGPTNHGSWNLPLRPENQKGQSLCLCGLWDVRGFGGRTLQSTLGLGVPFKRISGMMSLILGVSMDYTGSSDLGPTLGLEVPRTHWPDYDYERA